MVSLAPPIVTFSGMDPMTRNRVTFVRSDESVWISAPSDWTEDIDPRLASESLFINRLSSSTLGKIQSQMILVIFASCHALPSELRAIKHTKKRVFSANL